VLVAKIIQRQWNGAMAELYWQGRNRRTCRRACRNVTLSITKSYVDWTGIEPGPPVWKAGG